MQKSDNVCKYKAEHPWTVISSSLLCVSQGKREQFLSWLGQKAGKEESG